jgi:hypothetical protein
MILNRIAPAALAAAAMMLLLALGRPGGEPAAAAQAGSADSCPIVRVLCADSSDEGSPTPFSATVTGGDSGVEPTYNWTVSAGAIESGQGSASIRVGNDGVAGMTMTATVDVGGYDRACSTSGSCTASILGRAVRFGEYETADLSARTAILDSWVAALERDPGAQGYLIAYGGRASGPADAQKAADNATDYTMNVRGMDGARTLSGVGGYRERPTVELFISPPRGAVPMATPTVDPKDVKPR